MSAGCGYTLAIMNDAIKPGSETPSQAGLPELSVVVPTFNERDNVTVLYRRLEATLSGIAWEVVFVDDNSPDGTWEVVRGLARKDSRVRCVRRIGRRGLSGACIEGILASSGPYAAVIDADLQHDETQLPKMVALLRSGEAELVVGSRYIEGGSADSFNKQRAGASQLATEVARRALKVEVADPMSGFFMIRRDRFEQLAPAALDPGLQDPARRHCDRAGQTAYDRNSLHFRFAPARREQARFHGGAGFPRPGAGEADPRRGLAAFPVVCDGRGHRPCRASYGAVHRARNLPGCRLRRRKPSAR